MKKYIHLFIFLFFLFAAAIDICKFVMLKDYYHGILAIVEMLAFDILVHTRS